jgi:hypothetical protein
MDAMTVPRLPIVSSDNSPYDLAMGRAR